MPARWGRLGTRGVHLADLGGDLVHHLGEGVSLGGRGLGLRGPLRELILELAELTENFCDPW